MTSSQFKRLTIILVLPMFFFSWWLAQQDFVLERGQQINCDVAEQSCLEPFLLPLRVIESVEYGGGGLLYSDNPESIVSLNGFNYPIEASYFNETIKDKAVAPEITATSLESFDCRISGLYELRYNCSPDNVSIEISSGNIKFLDQKDAEQFNNLIWQAKEKLAKIKSLRAWIAVALFAVFFLSYLALAFAIKFVVYGLKSKKM